MSIRLLRPLSNRDFRLLWSGQAISYLGNGVMVVAMAWQTLALSPHATSLSIVFVARAVPLLAFSLVGGAITDRAPRRGILLASDAGRGIVVAVTAVLIATHEIRLWHLAVLSAMFGAAEAFFFPAFTAIVPEIVTGDALVQANSIESAIRPLTMRMLGPALGGIIIAAAGTKWAFAFDAASFGVSACFLVALRTRSAPERAAPSTLRADIVEGLRFVRSQAWIWATLLMAAFAVLLVAGPLDVLLPIYSRRHLLTDARGFGFLVGSMGAGGIVGALIVSQTGIGRRHVRNMFVTWAISVIPFAMLPLTAHLSFAMVLMASVGFGFEVGTIMWITLLQELVPPRLLGRVRSLDFLMSFALMPLSYAIAGPLANVLGVSTMIGLGGALAAAVTFAFMAWPGVLDPDRDDYMRAA